MKKPTSKSASANPKTSLPYGTSAETAATVKVMKTSAVKKSTIKKATSTKVSSTMVRKAFQVVSERANSMSPAEFRRSLVKAGIISEKGKLTSNYKVSKSK